MLHLPHHLFMLGWNFTDYIHQEGGSHFERLLKIFKDVLIHTSGDVREAFSWMTELDRRYHLTSPDYGIADFIRELQDTGYIKNGKNAEGNVSPTPTSKMEIALRRHALDDIFEHLKKTSRGKHSTPVSGIGDERTSDVKPYAFGDKLEDIAFSETLKNAQINHGLEELLITEEDLTLYENYQQAQSSTVLMIDISHSMILYGEDRITPAKKVAMALSEMITTRYPKDTLDIIVFGDDAWKIDIRDLPYLQVGPYHTNTVAGLELAMDILRKRKNPNKQIMMITDGKPTCIKKGKSYYKNSFGLDKHILQRTLALALTCRKMFIPVTTFMIARDPWLVHFVDEFTRINQGKAFYSSLEGLGEFVFMDYKQQKRKRRNS